LSAGFGNKMGTLSVVANNATGFVVVQHHSGLSPTSHFATIQQQPPSAPEEIVVSVVSNSELGVRWNAPVFTGGLSISKFLIEWDYSPYFISFGTAVYSDVVTFANAQSFINNGRADFSYQISGLQTLPTFVRVSAFNGIGGVAGGYGPAAPGFPINSTECNLMPNHCSVIPSSQVLFQPINPHTELSSKDVSNRLEVRWQQPLFDQFGFRTETIAPHTPAQATSYRIEWSTKKDFTDSTYFDLPMIVDDNQAVDCHVACQYSIGVEVQNVTVTSGNGFQLDGGSFHLLYVGKQTRNCFMIVTQDSATVTMLDLTITVAVGDFFRIAGSVYQVESVQSNYNLITLTTPFRGGFSDVSMAFHIPQPLQGNGLPWTLPYNANSSQVQQYLTSQLIGLYSQYSTIFKVSRQSLEFGYSWLVTFCGEMFNEDVDELVVVTSDIADGLSTAVTTPFTSNGGRTYLTQKYVRTLINVDALPEGVAVFVSVIAINNVGFGPREVCTVSTDGNGLGAIAPRSPPGLPIDVLVFAVPTSVGDQLKVTWSEGNIYGGSILQYTVEWSSDGGSVFPQSVIVPVVSNTKN
jgi:hypothetical protein